jgi:hypothetical protein
MIDGHLKGQVWPLDHPENGLVSYAPTTQGADPILMLDASLYADHPDYDPAWSVDD